MTVYSHVDALKSWLAAGYYRLTHFFLIGAMTGQQSWACDVAFQVPWVEADADLIADWRRNNLTLWSERMEGHRRIYVDRGTQMVNLGPRPFPQGAWSGTRDLATLPFATEIGMTRGLCLSDAQKAISEWIQNRGGRVIRWSDAFVRPEIHAFELSCTMYLPFESDEAWRSAHPDETRVEHVVRMAAQNDHSVPSVSREVSTQTREDHGIPAHVIWARIQTIRRQRLAAGLPEETPIEARINQRLSMIDSDFERESARIRSQWRRRRAEEDSGQRSHEGTG